MGLALGAWQVVYIVSAPVGGRLIDRLGIHHGILLGALVVAASGLVRAAAGGFGTFWLAIALFGVGGPLISAGAPKAVGLWFGAERERRLAIGAYSTMPAIGGMATLVLSNSVLMPLTGSWRATVVIETGLMVVALGVWQLITSTWDIWLFRQTSTDGYVLTRALVGWPTGILLTLLGFWYADRALRAVPDFPGLMHLLEEQDERRRKG
jgi:MFS family permease